jgi:hypothetical protein
MQCVANEDSIGDKDAHNIKPKKRRSLLLLLVFLIDDVFYLLICSLGGQIFLLILLHYHQFLLSIRQVKSTELNSKYFHINKLTNKSNL